MPTSEYIVPALTQSSPEATVAPVSRSAALAENNGASAVASPLRDLNALQTIIPEVLLAAVKDPYARPAPMTCARVSALLLPLNGALGADYDELAHDQDDIVNRGHGVVLGAVASAASSAIPFRGWVRQLSGAEKHDHVVNDAITAGAVRRGYLKGLGEQLHCVPPGAPIRSQAATTKAMAPKSDR